MRYTVFICLLLLVVLAQAAPKAKKAAKKYNQIKTTSPVAQAPQWNCNRVDKMNLRAKQEKTNASKCSYLWFLYNEIQNEYTTPQYPSCFAQLDAKCDEHIVDWKEKSNIRKFSLRLEAKCTGGEAQWEDVQILLDELKEKFGAALETEYWTCVQDTIAPWIEAQYETMRPFPAPFLDGFNWVCQGIEAGLANADRIAFNQWFEASGNFTSLTSLGRPLFEDMEDLFKSSGLHEDIVDCYSQEAHYFSRAVHRELEGAQNDKEGQGTGFSQAYWQSGYPEPILPLADDVFSEEEEGYPCWNYYAPTKHYHQDNDKVSEDAFDGNRGHPLCGPDTLYIPISQYGPICCPIHDARDKPYTYNCCSNSIDLKQVTTKRRRQTPMNRYAECAGCTCLEGYYMDVKGDYYGWGDDWNYGACIKEEDGELE